jgi:hypothetical protein
MVINNNLWDWNKAMSHKYNGQLWVIAFHVWLVFSSQYNNYSPVRNLTLGESLATYRGKSPFTVYIKSKPGHYGLKVFVCVCARLRAYVRMCIRAYTETVYVLKLHVWTGMTEVKRKLVKENGWLLA